ncbi:methyltransferase [Frateuria sp. GZRR33]|uniref:methyltransferase n=1 Tax=Frateuria sp. GZRR33 TaxID=3351535 RepID=UPI003EDC84E4
MKRKFQVDFLRNQGLQPNHFLVDIGCGSLRGGIPLIDYLQPGHYTGIDVRESVLDEARRELVREKLAHKRPNLIQAPNLGAVNPGTPVDVFWAFSVLFHLSDAILADCISMVARHLEPEGVFYANIIDGDGPPGAWQGFPVMPRPMATYRELAARQGLHIEPLGCLSALGHHSGEPTQDNQLMLAFRRPRAA